MRKCLFIQKRKKRKKKKREEKQTPCVDKRSRWSQSEYKGSEEKEKKNLPKRSARTIVRVGFILLSSNPQRRSQTKKKKKNNKSRNCQKAEGSTSKKKRRKLLRCGGFVYIIISFFPDTKSLCIHAVQWTVDYTSVSECTCIFVCM